MPTLQQHRVPPALALAQKMVSQPSLLAKLKDRLESRAASRQSDRIALSDLRREANTYLTAANKCRNALGEARGERLRRAERDDEVGHEKADPVGKKKPQDVPAAVCVAEICSLAAAVADEAFAISSPSYPGLLSKELESVIDALENINSSSVKRLFSFSESAAEETLKRSLEHKVERVISALIAPTGFGSAFKSSAERCSDFMYAVCERLDYRSRVEGIPHVLGSAMATDTLIQALYSVDPLGEIESGRKFDELTAYTLTRSMNGLKSVVSSIMFPLADDTVDGEDVDVIRRCCYIIEQFVDEVKKISTFSVDTLVSLQQPEVDEILSVLVRTAASDQEAFDSSMSRLLEGHPDRVVRDQSSKAPLDQTAQFEVKRTVQTLTEAAEIVELLRARNFDQAAPEWGVLLQYLLNRKIELRKFYLEENSFYTCRISAGDPWSRKAPGELQVVPAQKPANALANVLGSGYDEVRSFLSSIDDSTRWHSLFLATSPSKTVDKANVLLVGPAGCGKSEVLRSIGSADGSLAISVQGSDFLTCWRGEAEKNPKRLFEAAIKLHRESNRRVHLLIDEIDSVLNSDRDLSGNVNLTLEFQILMDGVVHYPGISVWGATNHLARIPIPMIRRFQRVLIVGELSPADRRQLLTNFLSAMPLNIADSAFDEAVDLLKGATGDVVRKVADEIWRDEMSRFVRNHPVDADLITASLGSADKLESKKRLADELSSFMSVDSASLLKHTRRVVGMLSVREEIKNAVSTYAEARRLLSSQENPSASLSSTVNFDG